MFRLESRVAQEARRTGKAQLYHATIEDPQTHAVYPVRCLADLDSPLWAVKRADSMGDWVELPAYQVVLGSPIEPDDDLSAETVQALAGEREGTWEYRQREGWTFHPMRTITPRRLITVLDNGYAATCAITEDEITASYVDDEAVLDAITTVIPGDEDIGMPEQTDIALEDWEPFWCALVAWVHAETGIPADVLADAWHPDVPEPYLHYRLEDDEDA